MPKTPARDDYFTQSFRFTPEQTAFLMIESLEKDRKALGLSQREYVLHLLARRYERVLSDGPGFDIKKSKR